MPAPYAKRNGEYLGKIIGGKVFIDDAATSEAVAKEINGIADLGSLQICGQRTGVCCGAEVTDADSIKAGIGPICATKWGFWGN